MLELAKYSNSDISYDHDFGFILRKIQLFYTGVVRDRKLCHYLIIHVNSVAYFAVYVVNKINKTKTDAIIISI